MGSHFRHTVRAATFCGMLLASGFFLLFHTSAAKSDPIADLLKLPAPPPPNPFIKLPPSNRGDKFFDRNSPPDDNAPIDELIDYWTQQSTLYQKLRFNPQPSDRSRDRLIKEVEAEPKLLPTLLNNFVGDAKAIDTVKEIYDREGSAGVFDKDTRKTIRNWLTYNSPYFSQDLERLASQAGDTGEYVSNQDELLALTRVDFDRARPMIDRLYGDSGMKSGRVLAQWALYRHALETGSTSDADRYRDELKAVVEDKSALPGMRDLAMDALISEKEFPGRDDWYFSLLSDPTLSDLKVNGQTYTGLTTMLLYAPPEKYVPRMIELLKSSDPVVRGNAVRNLISRVEDGGPEVIKALLPWLDDPKWAADVNDTRAILVRKLAEIDMPEAVPGIVKLLEEHHTVMVPKGQDPNLYASANAANAMANAAYAAANAIAMVSNANVVVNVPMVPVEQYPYRSAAIYALTKQKDIRAVPALRRTLNAIEGYERASVVKALFVSGGFTIAEQLDALEATAKNYGAEPEPGSPDSNVNAISYAETYANEGVPQHAGPLSPVELKLMLGQQIVETKDVSDGLARAVVDRIESIDKHDPILAAGYRRIVLDWPNAAVNLLFLRDVKRGIADVDTLIRLLGQRKALREKQPTDVFDLRTGTPRTIGIAACLLEDKNDYDTILDTAGADAKTALLACGRLIRAPLNVQKVVPNLAAKEPLLALAAERYLESEDSPAARAAVLSRHPGEAVIMGAMTAFQGDAEGIKGYEALAALFQSIGDQSLYNGWYGTSSDLDLETVEKRLRDEVKNDTTLIGIYSFDKNYIRIYQDKVIYSWDEDDSRYHERPLTREEFDYIKGYLASKRADEMPPYLYCGGDYCSAKELIMLGRNGGRRVYIAGDAEGYGTRSATPDFFVGLEKYFAELKKEPATLKYAMSREMPDLAIVYAGDQYKVATVWSNGSEIRVAASETATRDKLMHDLEALTEADETGGDYEETGGRPPAAEAEFEKRRYEGYDWFKVGANGAIEGQSVQPSDVEYLPIRDGLPVPSDNEQWKARAGTVEVRASADGLYKVSRGQLARVQNGKYERPVITPDGRWVVAAKTSEESGQQMVRVDLITKREYPITFEESYGDWYAAAYIPGLNSILIQRKDYRDYGGQDEDAPPEDIDVESMRLVNAATGAVTPFTGELRPFSQQTFRPLQKASKPGEYWAAMPDSEKNETQVGTIDTRTFIFKPLLRVPKIKFDSMRMWVDEARQTVYFVYRGHLLSLPVKIETRPRVSAPRPASAPIPRRSRTRPH
ncbi:MAG TPA: hypothetical protein VGO43_04860 [Pyrinomonadaceae bacterium]|nr:hypothetical protein [Pyrinomonadaceae bacterium]